MHGGGDFFAGGSKSREVTRGDSALSGVRSGLIGRVRDYLSPIPSYEPPFNK
jgi:hypothetical protein